MYIHETYNIDFNLDQLKNQDTPVCFAFNNPELNVTGPVRAMIQKLSRDLKCFNSEAKAECFKFYLLPRAMWLRD